MRFLRHLILIFNYKTIIVLTYSLLATYFCVKYGIKADYPHTLIGIAVVFPIVFSINEAYKRRELVLKHYGELKSQGRGIYYASRDWTEKNDEHYQEKLKALLRELLQGSKDFFNDDKSKQEIEEEHIYHVFTKLSLFIKDFRTRGMSGSEVSRANQFLIKMLSSFENMKHVYQYRTPRTLRAYSKVFVFVIPLIYAPSHADLFVGNYAWLSYIMPALLSIVLVSLDNIQEHLENPFDQVGEDDVKINPEKFIEYLETNEEAQRIK